MALRIVGRTDTLAAECGLGIPRPRSTHVTDAPVFVRDFFESPERQTMTDRH